MVGVSEHFVGGVVVGHQRGGEDFPMSHGMKVDRVKIVRLRDMGVTYDAIAERLGRSHATIRLAIKKREESYEAKTSHRV